MEKLSKNIEINMNYLSNLLCVNKSFDLVTRVIELKGHKAAIYCIDGFVKSDTLEKLLEFMFKKADSFKQPEDFPPDASSFLTLLLPYCEIKLEANFAPAVTSLLKGMSLLIIDGYDQLFIIDCRSYPARSISEPDKDKTMRGSRDGFVETLVCNTALIRRRIRDPKLIMEMQQAGTRSKTDICLCYLDDLVDKKLLSSIRKRIQNITVQSLTMNQESLAECIFPHKWFNPFPKFKFTERPDAACAAVFEGNLIILVDNSPSAMILPSSLFDIVEEADDYYFPPLTGTYLRLTRALIALMTYFVPVLYLLSTMHPTMLPDWLSFIAIKDNINVPIILQLLILELALDGLRLAAVNTPNMLSTPLSITAGIVLGEFSVKSGWFNSESMVYMAFIFVANYTQSSYEFGYALKFMRILTLILTAIFDFWGFAAGVILFISSMICNKTISGYPYLYPVIPFSWKALSRRFFRSRLTDVESK